MSRQRSPNRDKAFAIYKEHKGNIRLKDIAEQLGVSDIQIRKWKSTDKWEQQLKGTLPKKVPKTKGNVTNKKGTKKSSKEPIADEVKEVLENTELTDKQRLFCVVYAKRQNATKAYQKVYKCTYETAAVEGCKSLKNPKIREQIDRLLESELNKEFLKKGLIQQYKDIAFSDIGDYVEFGKKYILQWTKDKDGKDIPVTDPNTGEQKIKEYSYVDLKDSIGLDTSLITEVSEGKDGIKFKLADKMKAMDVLAKLSNLLSDEEKTKLDLEYSKLRNLQMQSDIENSKNNNSNQDGNIDKLIDAIHNSRKRRNEE